MRFLSLLKMSLKDLPSELIVHEILPHLDDLSKGMLRSTSKRFRREILLTPEIISAISFRQSRILHSAAELGYPGIIRWARSHNVPWTKKICAIAAGNGHFKVLKWLRSMGCPWDEETCRRADLAGYDEIKWWAIEQGCPWVPYQLRILEIDH